VLNTVLELAGLATGAAALACFVVAAWSASTVAGLCVLGAALAVVAVVLVVIANTRKAPNP
jgi:1-aminocyclopropane-1-carboxylate deaminase/D-cysteine desulfhydrase-like pyridoxal-dependent ACC family enzyme